MSDPSAAPASPPDSEQHHDRSHVHVRNLIQVFNAIKAELKHDTRHKTRSYHGGFDPTPFPDCPAGWTVRFVFHGAKNLPPADISTQSCDPFIHATLTAPVPCRHDEDPFLTKRTKTIHNTCEPTWEEEWIVANVPSAGFKLKCRLYDEDYPDRDDRLGNVTLEKFNIGEGWSLGPDGQWFDIEKHMGSKRAYLFKAITSTIENGVSMTGLLHLSITVIGRSDGNGSQIYTVGPSIFFKHFSPLLGRLTGVRVNEDESDDEKKHGNELAPGKIQRFDFQANEIQLQGPVPEHLYHRYFEYSPWVKYMFTSRGFRGTFLHQTLRKQHRRIYNFDKSTQWGIFESCSEAASLQFLRMAHFDGGGRVFTYVLTLDGLLRFTETGPEFAIDFLSKHGMHSDVATYIACAGEFFIRRVTNSHAPERQRDSLLDEVTDASKELPGGSPLAPPPTDPRHYQLVIDNDSGTYRPDKIILPYLHDFLQRNFPGLGILTLHWDDPKAHELKNKQRESKKTDSQTLQLVQKRSPGSSCIDSDDVSRLRDMISSHQQDGHQQRGGKE